MMANMAEAKKYPSDRADKFSVRFPVGMRDEISLLADANGRSMNTEIIARLKSSIEINKGLVPYYDQDRAIADTKGKYKSYLSSALKISEELLEREGKEMDSQGKAEFIQLIMDLLEVDSNPDIVKAKIQNVVSIVPHLKKT